MTLATWATNPLANGPPPIPLDTPVHSPTSAAYSIAHIDPLALADELAPIGYATGYGNGYRLDGEPITAHAVSLRIAEAFTDAADALARFLATDSLMLDLANARTMIDWSRPRGDPATWSASDRAELAYWSDELDRLEHLAPLDPASGWRLTDDQLDQARQSLKATADAIKRSDRVRTLVRTHFRPVMTAPIHPTPEQIAAPFLASLPRGFISRADLRSRAEAARVPLGLRDLYAVTRARYSETTIRGVRGFRVL